ncbi:MAG: hypothetical protein FJX22_02270 [Alphaproteobacteria bacterium]|nr:hypothetical protein [Alphaproteobacteria bacterium]
MQSIQDRSAPFVNGFSIIFIVFIAVILAGVVHKFLLIPVAIIATILLSGLTIIQPNESNVVTFFGKYVGTIKQSGLGLQQKIC